MTAPVSQVLSEAADLLEKPGAWTQGMFSVNAEGDPVLPFWTEAQCFCAVGAVAKVLVMNGTSAENWLDTSSGFHGLLANSLEDFNDTEGRTQAEVVAKLREAAALAKEQGR